MVPNAAYTFTRNQWGSSYSRPTSKQSAKPAERQCLLIMWKHTAFNPSDTKDFPEKDKNISHCGSSVKWVH